MSDNKRIERPFVQGMNTDQPDYLIAPNESSFAQDVVAPDGIARQRKGYTEVGTVDSGTISSIGGIARQRFVLADSKVYCATSSTGTSYIAALVASDSDTITGSYYNQPGGTTNQNTYLPRAAYFDELLFCAQDGITPMARYSGAVTSIDYVGILPAFVGTSSAVASTEWTYDSTPTSPAPGQFFAIADSAAGISLFPSMQTRIINFEETSVGTGTAVLESVINNGTAFSPGRSIVSSFGYTYPCVEVYAAGRAQVTTAYELTGTNTEWSGGDWGTVNSYNMTEDGVLFRTSDTEWLHLGLDGVTAGTTITLNQVSTTYGNNEYAITRRAPFKDVCVRDNVLFGAGVAQYPSRVYYGTPGWRLGFPPGYSMPVAVEKTHASSDKFLFLMSSVDIPSAYDGDDIAALLDFGNATGIIKRGSIYGIFGDWPSYSTELLSNTAGSIDIRSCQNTPVGPMFAGEDGIYVWDGEPIDLTDRKINREWRSLTDDFTDYASGDFCSLGVIYDHIIVSISTASGSTQRTYVYDIRNQAWISRFSNIVSRCYFRSGVPDEPSELYAADVDEANSIHRMRPMFDKTGNAYDADGTAPQMQAYTTTAMSGGYTDDSRMLDLAVHANVYGTGTGTTTLDVDVHTGGVYDHAATVGTEVLSIDHDSVDRIDRHYVRQINKPGRYHQVRVDVSSLGDNDAATSVEIASIEANFRNNRRRA